MAHFQKSIENLLFASNVSKAFGRKRVLRKVSMTSAFTEYSVLPAFVSGMLYGTALLIAAMIIYSAKMQVHRLNAG